MSIDPPGVQLSRLAPARKLLLQDLAAELLAGSRHGRLLIAVDGPTAAGKTTFADELALALRDDGATVFRASMDDFLLPRARRYQQGRTSPEGRYQDSYDYSLFRRVLVDPFLMAGSTGFVLAGFDRERDVPFESDWQTARADAIVVVDGSFVLRPELRGIWYSSIWLDADSETRARRIQQRDGLAPSSAEAARYSGAFELYLRTSPVDAAAVMIDNSDIENPRRN
ncbi:MAG: uridine kinase [Pseudolysinimonas sp.]